MPSSRSGPRHRRPAVTALALAGAALGSVLLGPTGAVAGSAGDNGVIAFVSYRDGNDEIYVMDAEGNGQTNLSHDPADDQGPAVSPDGQQIVFSSDRDGDFEIWVMNANGTHPRRLTNNATNDFQPSFSPDGSRIAFTTDRHGAYQVYAMNADGTGQTRLTHDDGASSQLPVFSPDGSRIAFTRNLDVWAMDSDGSNPVQLTEDPEEDTAPSFSPDGTKIVFATARNGFDQYFYDIYVMDADGANETPLTTSIDSDLYPVYSPDGSRIAFSRSSGSNAEVYVMGADGSEATNLTGNAAVDGLPDWGARDNVPPQTQVTSGPPHRTSSQVARFRFASTDRATVPSAMRLRCRLDAASWRGCASPKTYRALSPGRHTFRVRATDGAGNTDASPAAYVWRITRPQ
jgi:Tol biopolymer transport system component